jgi:hypothetical protein
MADFQTEFHGKSEKLSFHEYFKKLLKKRLLRWKRIFFLLFFEITITKKAPPKGVMKTIVKKILSFVDDDDVRAVVEWLGNEVFESVVVVAVKGVVNVVVISVVVVAVKGVVNEVAISVVVVAVKGVVNEVVELVIANGKVLLLVFFGGFCWENVETRYIFNLKL